MKIFLLVLFLFFASNYASNGDIHELKKVDSDSGPTTTINLSKNAPTYFYYKYESGGSYLYFYFLFDTDSINTFEACSTDTEPTKWAKCQDVNGIHGFLVQEHKRKKDGKYEFYEYYKLENNASYLTVKYPRSSLDKFEVKVSGSDFYEKVKKENERSFLTGLLIFIYIVLPCIALAIIIGIIVCCCICLRKRKVQGMVGNPQPYATNANFSPMTYSNIEPTPVTQENLLYNNPS